MTSTRAPAVAEVLWELKRADKISTFTAIAERAGFSAGVNGRAMATCLNKIRKEWPHLHWWRAVRDDLSLKKGDDQAEILKDWGVDFTVAENDDDKVILQVEESRLMAWPSAGSGKDKNTTAAQADVAE